jgi:GT2 family glycosyltransferase
MNKPSVFIIVLNWNGINDTLACLDSLAALRYSNFNVIVVDNGSTDDSLVRLRPHITLYPLTLLETGRNLGYAGGNNVGIRHALEMGADFVFVLNNDTVVAPDLLDQLTEAAGMWPNDGIYGPIILYEDQPEKIWSAGASYDLEKLGTFHIDNGKEINQSTHQTKEVEFLVGAALFLSAKALKETGEFETKYFLVHEETDWCCRAKRKGFHCRLVANAKIWHKVGSSFGSESSPLRTYFSVRNHLLFAERNLPKWSFFRLIVKNTFRLLPKFCRVQAGKEMILKRLFWALSDTKRLWNDLNQKATRRGVMDYFLRRFGDCPDDVRVWSKAWAAQRRDS